jgi:pyruvate/2-oxoglutarate dehydrogenase complex dihydrolipoamide dehydrogenase (E3) component
MGTSKVPPRSFLGLAAHEEGHHVAEMIGERMAEHLAGGDLLHEILHLAHKAVHELKDAAEHILNEDERKQN